MFNKKNMLRDLDRYSPEDVVNYWNLRRIGYVIILVMLLEFVNLFDADVKVIPYLYITSRTLLAIGAPMLLLVHFCVKNFERMSARLVHCIYLCFWIFIPSAVAFSFFIRDAQSDRPPLNLLIIIGLIAMVPILNARETILVFILPFVANLAVSVYVRLNYTYIMYSVIFTLTGVFITVIVHRQYILLIHELSYRTRYDALTNILNRQCGGEKSNFLLSVAKREDRTFAVMMIDIDYFKSYNDTRGHLYGDEVLKKVAQVIGESFKRDTDVVYRYGGEEFCVCFIADDNLQCHTAKLTDAIKALGITAANPAVSELLTVSVGIALSDSKDATLDALLECADGLLYVSKNTGRNKVTVKSFA